MDFLVDEKGGCYVTSPLFHLFFPRTFDEGSWMHLLDLDPTILSLPQKGGSIGEILSRALPASAPLTITTR